MTDREQAKELAAIARRFIRNTDDPEGRASDLGNAVIGLLALDEQLDGELTPHEAAAGCVRSRIEGHELDVAEDERALVDALAAAASGRGSCNRRSRRARGSRSEVNHGQDATMERWRDARRPHGGTG